MADSTSSSGRRANRRMFIIIAVMVAVWLLIVLCRNPIRARWWTRKLVATGDPEIRLIYFQRLVALGPTGADAVETLLRSEEAAVRGFGVALVNHTRPPRARALLAGMTTDGDQDVATMAVTGLALLGDPAVIEDFAELLHAAEPRLQTLAARGLGRLRTPPAIDLLIETARTHSSVAARVQAIEELGRLQVERAAGVLQECLVDDTPFDGPTVSERSAAALLARAAPGMQVEEPPPSRPISYFAARALGAITGDEITTNGDDDSE